MRGCLVSAAIVIAVAGALVWFALPPLLGTLAQGALVAVGFDAAATSVTVAADPPPRLLTLEADVVHIAATNVRFRGLVAAEADVTLRDVHLLDRTFGSLQGTLRGVRLTAPAGDEIGVPLVELAGTPDAIRATLTVPAADAQALGSAAVERAIGITPSRVRLVAPDQVRIEAGGQAIEGRLAVREGSLVLVPPAALGLDPVPLVAGTPELPLRVIWSGSSTAGWSW